MNETSEKLNGRKWLTALLVSPGMLFLFGYLFLVLSVHVYLNGVVKSYLNAQNFSIKTEQCQAEIGHIDVDFWLTSLTIRDLRLSIVPLDVPGEKSVLSASKERYFSAVKISGNWIRRIVALQRTSLDKIVITFSSDERPRRLLTPILTVGAAVEPEWELASTESARIKGDIVRSEFTDAQNPTLAHERLNSLLMEVLTVLSSKKL